LLEISTFLVVVLVSFFSVMIFLAVSSVVVVLQGQIVLERLLMMLSMAQEALEAYLCPWCSRCWC